MVRGLCVTFVLMMSVLIMWDPASAGFSRLWDPASAGPGESQIRLTADPTRAGYLQDKGPDPAVTRASELVRRWRVVIGTTFEERRASAMEPIMDEIEIVISPGAVKAAQDRANDQQLKAADALMQRFALAMVAAGERLPDGSVHIGEEAIDAGLAKICPAYPLCSK